MQGLLSRPASSYLGMSHVRPEVLREGMSRAPGLLLTPLVLTAAESRDGSAGPRLSPFSSGCWGNKSGWQEVTRGDKGKQNGARLQRCDSSLPAACCECQSAGGRGVGGVRSPAPAPRVLQPKGVERSPLRRDTKDTKTHPASASSSHREGSVRLVPLRLPSVWHGQRGVCPRPGASEQHPHKPAATFSALVFY